MCKTEKEKRLERALNNALTEFDCYKLGGEIMDVKILEINVQHLIDKDGHELRDLTILEEAVSGDLTGSVSITVKELDGQISLRYHIDYGAFDITDYSKGVFSIEISKPVTIRKV